MVTWEMPLGYMFLSERGTILIKNEVGNHQHIMNSLIIPVFQNVKKREYENIIRVYFGVVPQVEPVFHFSAFLEKI